MSDPMGILIIDDDPAVREAVASTLASEYVVHSATSGEEGLELYERLRPDLVLLDVMLPQMGGLAVLRSLKRARADVPVIMMTAYAEVQTAVQAIKLGATDYLEKPLDPAGVRHGVDQAVARASQIRESMQAAVIGRSAAMTRVWRLVERFGPTDIPILLQGETGTGKGLIAASIHGISKRAQAPFVAIDCATIPGDLAESELFGYEDGAFTGAGKKKRGRVAFADRGTLFLDEIGTLAIGTQAKLLTLLEQQHFLPLGARSFQPTHLDVRFISATNLPLHDAVDAGTFRADLFHRLNGVIIDLPPLRDRDGDIDLLARHFVGQFGARHGKPDLDIADDALDALRRYSWPGNVRELQRVVSAAVVLANDVLVGDDLPVHVRDGSRAAPPPPPPDDLPGADEIDAADPSAASINLREIKEWAGREAQKRVIQELQKRTNITRQELARMLGVDPKTLRSRLREISTTPVRVVPPERKNRLIL
jgi:DNA-binding NtrC family response regulator